VAASISAVAASRCRKAVFKFNTRSNLVFDAIARSANLRLGPPDFGFCCASRLFRAPPQTRSIQARCHLPEAPERAGWRQAEAESGGPKRKLALRAIASKTRLDRVSNLNTAFRQREAATALMDAATQSYAAALCLTNYAVRSLWM